MNDIHLLEINYLNELAMSKAGSHSIAKSFVNQVKNRLNTNSWVTYETDVNVLADKIYDNRGKPLSGLIIGVKDVIATEEFPTMMGSPTAWRNHNMGFDARIISNFKMSGAVIGGKTKTSEFAVHKETDVINPHFPGMTAGTSSAGSAAAIANRTAKLTIGTQTAGSIARPASYCNVMAMKPTFGFLPRTGVLKTCDPFDTLGMFSDSVNALSLSLAAVRVKGKNYPIVSQYDAGHEVPFTRVMVLVGEGFDCAPDNIRQQVVSIGKNISKELGLNYVQSCSKEFELETIRRLHADIYRQELRYYFQEEITSNSLSTSMIKFLDQSPNSTFENHQSNLNALSKWRKKYSGAIGQSLVLSVAANHGAPEVDASYDFDMNLVITAAGCPQVIMPNLLTTTDNKYVGLSVSGNKFADNSILDSLKMIQKK